MKQTTRNSTTSAMQIQIGVVTFSGGNVRIRESSQCRGARIVELSLARNERAAFYNA